MNPMTSANLFITCLMDTLFPDTAQAVVDILDHVGIRVNIPNHQTCCGQPAYNAGHWGEAKAMARYNLDLFSEIEGPIIIPSGSCGAMLTHQYLELFRDDPVYLQKAKALSGRVFEFTQFLVDHLEVVDLGAKFSAKVVYHPSCHTLREMKIDRQPKQLLTNIDGVEILAQENPETCCGFGGVFSVKMPDISGGMLANRIAAFEAAQPDYVVGCDISCLMHIEGGFRKQGLPIQTMHIAELLAKGLNS
jgi:L-lactate dehydrogenase complex protein LldE